MGTDNALHDVADGGRLEAEGRRRRADGVGIYHLDDGVAHVIAQQVVQHPGGAPARHNDAVESAHSAVDVLGHVLLSAPEAAAAVDHIVERRAEDRRALPEVAPEERRRRRAPRVRIGVGVRAPPRRRHEPGEAGGDEAVVAAELQRVVVVDDEARDRHALEHPRDRLEHRPRLRRRFGAAQRLLAGDDEARDDPPRLDEDEVVVEGERAAPVERLERAHAVHVLDNEVAQVGEALCVLDPLRYHIRGGRDERDRQDALVNYVRLREVAAGADSRAGNRADERRDHRALGRQPLRLHEREHEHCLAERELRARSRDR